MSEAEKLRALLAEARAVLAGTISAHGLMQRIDAALAEPVEPIHLPPMNDREVALLYGHEAFVGPCVHGRDPWDRCETCGEGTALEAAVLVIKALTRQRNEARAEVRRTYKELSESIAREAEAYECGARAMREAAARLVDKMLSHTLTDAADRIRALPVPEDKP